MTYLCGRSAECAYVLQMLMSHLNDFLISCTLGAPHATPAPLPEHSQITTSSLPLLIMVQQAALIISKVSKVSRCDVSDTPWQSIVHI